MPQIEVSVGELVDKITILQIKQNNISDEAKLRHIKKELIVLEGVMREDNIKVPDELIEDLRAINQALWDAEDVIRACEINEAFGESFVQCARLDAILNDKRFLVKNKINEHTESLIKEQKSYEGLYTTD